VHSASFPGSLQTPSRMHPGRIIPASCCSPFQLSILHNIGHLVFGVAGLLLARTVSGARNYLVGAGLIYLGFRLL
jgi:hypothetical protein